jgi:hypothetical protein
MNTPSTNRRPEPINDIEMFFELHGDGEPLVLLHGGDDGVACGVRRGFVVSLVLRVRV